MRYGSVCSGIEAASVAWEPLGWQPAWFAEIEPFPSAVLAHHYPDVKNLGDLTAIARAVLTGEVEAPDMLCGGTPCQAFSVAGLRESLADERGNLTLKFVELADAIDHIRVRRGDDASIIFWENVPGVLSTADNAFGCFLAGLAGENEPLVPAGGKWSNSGAVYGPARSVAWRTLDAQYFGLAQRRRRVFVVASARDRFDPAQVLFEWDGVRRDTAPGRTPGKGSAHDTAPCLTSRGRGVERTGDTRDQDPVVAVYAPDVARCIATREGSSQDWESTTMVAHSLRGEGFDASEDGTGRGTPLVPVAFDTTQITSAANYSNPQQGGPCHPLAAGAHAPAIAFHPTQDPISSSNVCHSIGANDNATAAVACWGLSPDTFDRSGEASTGTAADRSGLGVDAEVAYALRAKRAGGVATAMQVRRLTPVECERLQGFPDNYTNIPWSAAKEAARKGISYEVILAMRGMTLRGPNLEECPDGPRYKALGNSWAVPVVRWIGRRIQGALS
jgi:DNA (cytosine-5)-methyltransferase 1